jgi:hypothetical protein
MYPDQGQRILSRSRRWAVCAIAVAVLLAPGMHHHAEAGGAHQDCYVCGQLARDNAPPPAAISLPSPSATVFVLSASQDETPCSFLPSTSRARGPPACIA